MSKRWTAEEDAFLLTYHKIPGGADFVASHDLGRPHGAGSRRLKKLTESGARLAFEEAQLLWLRFEIAAGRPPHFVEEEIERWEQDIAETLAETEA